MKANTTDPPPASVSASAEAVTALYRAHALGLIRLAVVMLGDRPAAEDVVQEAFCGLYRRWHSLSDTGKALSYVRSSVINGCRSVLRRRRRQAGGLAGDPPGESAESAALISEEHREVLNGKTLATINPPTADGTIVAVTAAADDRTFVLSVQHRASRGGNQAFEARTFYMFRLSSSGQPGQLTKLPMSVAGGGTVSGLALSPSGRKLAIAVEPNNNKKDLNLQEIRVYTLGTGAVRTWKGDGYIGSDPGDTKSVSWTADERTLAFDWSSANSGGVRLLNVGAPGSSLLADSRLQARFPAPSLYGPPCEGALIITPDGSSIVCGAIQGIEHISNGVDHGRDAVTEFREYSTATGKIVSVFGPWTTTRAGNLVVNVLWSNSAGSLLIGVIPTTGNGRVGVISENSFTPIPGQGNSTSDQSGAW